MLRLRTGELWNQIKQYHNIRMKSIPRSTTHPIIMLNPSEGKVKNSEGKYVFVGTVYGTKSINEDPEKIKELLRIFPRLNEHQLKSASDGVYTWLLYSVEDSDVIRFICTEVVSPFEIGTRHQSIAYNERVNASKIYGGGEFIKTENAIKFNILSGTYSKPIVQFNFNRSITKQIVDSFKLFFPEAEYDPSGNSYIHSIKTVSNDVLDLYKRLGYIVRVFDTQNEWVRFQNKFWNLDFNIEHYFKKAETATDKNRPIFKTLYIDSLQQMIELLDKDAKKLNKTGGRKTRKNRRPKGDKPQKGSKPL